MKMILIEHPSKQLVDDLSRACWVIVEQKHIFVMDMILIKCLYSLQNVASIKIMGGNVETYMGLHALNLLCKSPMCSQIIIKNLVENHFLA